ncbi:MAG: SGNH/GDSL hydrolase family protein [Nitrospina sp.]|jgi:lysophospholipase L1-like esterase|nr:SGNH/GDSL hydrolase family protein [Nitrospina sp.]MBT3874667.1 SGNH/GDSL hydrolase family protein [Nitrospina sp.]MBT4049401.1 SGNH/GDSL hydrolase family protein [Nitrospina sp.]MBT4556304.1 SGNH/GDSL hydrolase family protein [Nitrospina sp.]MBT5347129.1 SGNH/GDSL hydrolase family protein [Nitrospina sp.]
MAQAHSKKKIFIFISIPFIFFLFLLEVGLGIWGDTQPNRVLCYDPILGRSYCPNTKGYLKENQINMYVEVNADGLLGKSYPIARTPEKLRVAVLGDSFTSGEAVPPEKKFAGVWETKLSETFPPGVEVINFGVGGTGTWQQLQRFHIKARKYTPDLTVLAFCWCNDVGNNIDQLFSKADSRNPLLDQYDINIWTQLNVKRKNFNKWLWNNSSLYQFTRTRYNHLEHLIKRIFLPDYMKGPASTRGLHYQKGIHSVRRVSLASAEENKVQTSPDIKDTTSIFDDLFFFDSGGWEITRKLIIKLQSEVRENGSKLAVIHFGGQGQYHSSARLPLKQFDNFLSSQGIEHLNAFELFEQMKDADIEKYFIPNDGHFSEAGHAEFAGMAMKLLIKLLQTKA